MSWHKSSYSNPSGNCVEVDMDWRFWVGVRDSKAPAQPALWFTHAQWAAFVAKIRREEGQTR